MGKQLAYIFDIDGTLAKNNSGRSFYAEGKELLRDDVNTDVADVLERLDSFTHIIIMSGRKEGGRAYTAQWLRDNGIYYDELIMRKSDDNRKDDIVKKELYEEFVEPEYIALGVFDDRQQVVDMWRDLGLTCFQVAKGDF